MRFFFVNNVVALIRKKKHDILSEIVAGAPAQLFAAFRQQRGT
jgi:hypothetical protein